MARVAEVRTAHTADLDASVRKAARALLDDVFEDMTDHDWEHARGRGRMHLCPSGGRPA